VIGIQSVFGRLRVRVVPDCHRLVLGMVRRVRFGMGCGVVPDLLVIAPLVLALARRGQVPWRFLPMVVLMFAGYFHKK
jgi:hypothetical protein